MGKDKKKHQSVKRVGVYGAPRRNPADSIKGGTPRTFEALPVEVRERALAMRDDALRSSDWVEFVDKPQGDLYFVARKYDGDNCGTIVVCRVVSEITWGDWS